MGEYHVVEGAAVFSKDLKQDQEFKTVEGREIEVEKYGTHVRINKYAHVTSADNAATNGVVHIIDRVLVFHDPLAMQKGFFLFCLPFFRKEHRSYAVRHSDMKIPLNK